jgi:hypothetical protein
VKIAFTKQEKLLRAEAQRILDNPKADHWHRSRAENVLAKTRSAAETRRNVRVPAAQGPEPARRPDPVTVQEHVALLKFWAALVGEDEARRLLAEVPIKQGRPSDPPAASVMPRAAAPLAEKFCERCQVSFEICHCDKPKPARAELAAVSALDAKNNVESADDLTPCPLCLIPRGQCHHSGRRNPTADISFLQAQMMGQG